MITELLIHTVRLLFYVLHACTHVEVGKSSGFFGCSRGPQVQSADKTQVCKFQLKGLSHDGNGCKCRNTWKSTHPPLWQTCKMLRWWARVHETTACTAIRDNNYILLLSLLPCWCIPQFLLKL